jgi:hypothetical protein
MYVKQRNSFSCAPIAIINIGKWLGLPWTYEKQYKLFVEQMKCDKDGISPKEFVRTLKTLDAKFDMFGQMELADIEKALEKGSIVAISSKWYYDGKPQIHLMLVVKQSLFSFQVVNAHDDLGSGMVAKQWFEKKVFEKEYLQVHGNYPLAWVIDKKT